MNMGTDIDEIEAAYVKAGGGGIAVQQCTVVPCWWRSQDHTRDEMAEMVGKAVAFAWQASYQHDPSIREVSVRNDGIHLTVLVRKLEPTRSPGVYSAVSPPDGWVQERVYVLKGRIDALKGRIDALGIFHG